MTATLVALVFPLGLIVGPFRIVTVDPVLVPLLLLTALVLTQVPVNVRLHAPERALLFLLGFLLISSIASTDPLVSLNMWTVWMRAGLFYLSVRYLLSAGILTLHTISRDLSVVWAVLLFVGLVQVITGTQFGLLANYLGSGGEQLSTFGEVRRVSGTTSEANVYGQFIVMLSLLTNAYLLLERQGWGRLFLFTLLLVAELTVLIGTLSRATVGLFVVGHSLLGVYWIRASTPGSGMLKVGLTGLAVMILSGLAFYLVSVGGTLALLALRFSEAGDGRWLQIAHGFEILSEPKIMALGTGLGTFYEALMEAGIPISPREAWHFAGSRVSIHNGPLLLLVEGGVVTAALFIAFLLGGVLTAFRCLGSRAVPGMPGGLSAALAIILLTYTLIPFQLYMTAVTYPVLLLVLLAVAMTYHLDDCRYAMSRSGASTSTSYSDE